MERGERLDGGAGVMERMEGDKRVREELGKNWNSQSICYL